MLNRKRSILSAVRDELFLLRFLSHQPDSSYLIADNVIYLVIAEKSYPRKLAFSYLDEVSKEFQTSYGAKVDSVRKPYAFVGFGASSQHYGPLVLLMVLRG